MKFSIISVLALTVAVTAQSSDQCGKDTNNIQNQGDASALNKCKTVSGDLVLSEDVSEISLDGIENIGGSLIVRGARGLTSLSGSQLATIGKTFELTNLTILTNLNFPSLTQVGSIDWLTVPILKQLSFTQQIQKASSVRISDTGLSTLNGINIVSAEIFDINNNKDLSMVDLQLGNVSNALLIQENSKAVTASFPNLIWANNVTFRNVSKVMLPSLAAVNGSMGFYSDLITSFIAPNLTKVGGTLSFVDNNSLTNLSLPALKEISGGFQIANNSMLAKVDGLPKLEIIGGAADFHGPIEEAPLPSLNSVRGAFSMQSSEEFDCKQLNDFKKNGVIRGGQRCRGKVSSPAGDGSLEGSGTGSGSSGSQAAASGGYEVDMLALGAATGLVPLLLRLLF